MGDDLEPLLKRICQNERELKDGEPFVHDNVRADRREHLPERLRNSAACAVFLGMDIRGWGKRRPAGQFAASLELKRSLELAMRVLGTGGMLWNGQPVMKQWTGDGAYLVFISLEGGSLLALIEQAFSTAFAINAIVHHGNRHARVDDMNHATVPRHPLGLRFALSMDREALFMTDLNGNLSCAGDGILTCARIIASDHGQHFLVEEEVVREVEPYGGINAVGGERWDQQLNWSLLPETYRKNHAIEYYDVFGSHTDEPLLRATGRFCMKPRRCQIGSHDVGVLDR